MSQRNSRDHHSATRTMRSQSFFAVKLTKAQRQLSGCRYSMVLQNKIHRVLLNSNTEVEFVNLVSPSCIWVRLKKNITKNLEFEAPYPMKQALQFDKEGKTNRNDIVEYNYYLAPRQAQSLEDNDDSQLLYSRVRLLSKKEVEGELLCYVFYIDHGYGIWLNAKCLGTMPKSLYTYPWQVIPVSLLGVSPVADFDEDNSIWTKTQCSILRSILQSSKQFIARPALCKFHTIKDYNNYARVELDFSTEDVEEGNELQKENKKPNDGLEEMDKTLVSERGVNYKPKSNSVAAEFYNRALMLGESLLFKPDCDEVTEQKLFNVEDEIPQLPDITTMLQIYFDFPSKDNLRDTEEEVEEKTKAKEVEKLENEVGLHQDQNDDPVHRKNKKEEKELNDLIEWDPEIEELEKEDRASYEIKQFDYNLMPEAHFKLVLNTDCSRSPYEIYGHLIKAEESIEKCYESVLSTYDELDEWQEKLNDFYLNSTNCKRIDRERIYKAIKAYQEVYAILRITDQLEQSLFVRVKVIDYKNPDSTSNDISHCLVQLIDRGGTLDVNSDTLLRMHSRHTKEPPKSIQLCLSKIVPAKKDSQEPNEPWGVLQREKFRQTIGANAPLICQLINTREELNYCSNDPVYKNQGTHYIKDLRFLFESDEKTVEERLIRDKVATRGECLLEF